MAESTPPDIAASTLRVMLPGYPGAGYHGRRDALSVNRGGGDLDQAGGDDGAFCSAGGAAELGTAACPDDGLRHGSWPAGQEARAWTSTGGSRGGVARRGPGRRGRTGGGSTAWRYDRPGRDSRSSRAATADFAHVFDRRTRGRGSPRPLRRSARTITWCSRSGTRRATRGRDGPAEHPSSVDALVIGRVDTGGMYRGERRLGAHGGLHLRADGTTLTSELHPALRSRAEVEDSLRSAGLRAGDCGRAGLPGPGWGGVARKPGREPARGRRRGGHGRPPRGSPGRGRPRRAVEVWPSEKRRVPRASRRCPWPAGRGSAGPRPRCRPSRWSRRCPARRAAGAGRRPRSRGR